MAEVVDAMGVASLLPATPAPMETIPVNLPPAATPEPEPTVTETQAAIGPTQEFFTFAVTLAPLPEPLATSAPTPRTTPAP
jgi:hypothetical protein